MSPLRSGRVALIANPAAGRGRGERVLAACETALRTSGCEPWCLRSASAGEAVELASRAARDGASAVVAIGGDGTVHEVINGLMRIERDRRPPLTTVGAGTGNDYAIALRSARRKPEAIVRGLLGSRPEWVGVGRLRGVADHDLHFGIGVGLAVLAAASSRLRRSRPLPGRLSYFVGGVLALLGFRPQEFEITIDGDWSRERVLALHLGLCATTGGGYRLTPEAGIDSGKLQVATVRARPRLVALAQWPRISRGKPVPGVEIRGARRIRVVGEPNLLLHVDGEVRRSPGGIIEAEHLPDELRVLRVVDGAPESA